MFDQNDYPVCDECFECCWSEDEDDADSQGLFTQWVWHARANLSRVRAVVGRTLRDLRRVAAGERVCNPSAERDEDFDLCPEAWRMMNRVERRNYRIGYGMAYSAFDRFLQASLTREEAMEQLIAFDNGPLLEWEVDDRNYRFLPPMIRPN